MSNKPNKPANHRKPWSVASMIRLDHLLKLGLSFEKAGKIMERTSGACENRLTLIRMARDLAALLEKGKPDETLREWRKTHPPVEGERDLTTLTPADKVDLLRDIEE